MDQTATLTPERLLRTLEWRVLRRLDGRLQGDYRSLFRGTGLDFTNLREYEPGDDLRHIEWNVTARMDTPYVREYIEDREITAWLLLDHSASMGFGPVDRQKDLVLAEVATTLASVLAGRGNRVGAVLFDREVEQVIPPRSGRNQVLRIARALLQQRASTPPIPRGGSNGGRFTRKGANGHTAQRFSKGTVTDLSQLLRSASGLARRRSVVIVLSDFISAPGWERELGRLARRHEVVALQVSDPREHELPNAGMIYVEDAETGEQIFVDTADAGFRARLHEAADARQAQLEEATRSAGVELYRLSTDEDLVRSLLRISALRRRGRR
ncbi:MAG: DUF58 domain-containing protein [Actinomycetota bacterium]|nr:DUF58 domain-containing protein [Actinomycetota bacterium]